MLNLKIKNADILIKKAKTVTKLQKDMDKNIFKYSALFEEMLNDETIIAILELTDQEFRFVNDPKWKLPNRYGIKARRFVVYSGDKVEKDFDGNPIYTKDNGRGIRVSNLIKEFMKSTLNIEPIFQSFIAQLEARGEQIANDPTISYSDDEETNAIDLHQTAKVENNESTEEANESSTEEDALQLDEDSL